MKRKLGADFRDEGCEFTVWAPEVNQLEILLKRDNKNIPLQKDDLGYWSVYLADIKPGDLYKYKINQDTYPDPASASQPEGVHGYSQVIDHNAFKWTDTDWKGIPLEDYIIYELHTGTYTPEGTFEGIKNKISYLKELGITAIELLPVAQCPGDRNWGYDGVFPFAVQHSYGDPAQLKQLVDACHQNGIAVIMDVVYNHMGPEGNYLSDYGPYYTDKYNIPWGKAINFDGAHCDEVRNYFIQNALMWFKDYHIDALRLDAVHAYYDFSATKFLQQLSAEVKILSTEKEREYILIGECDLNDPAYIRSLEENGMGLHAQWADEFHHAVHSYVSGEQNGYYSDFGKLSHVYKAFKDGYVYTGEYSEHRKKSYGRPLHPDNHYRQLVIFSQNHDQIGNRLMGDRLSTLVSFEALKLIAATVILSPSIPLLYMGEEYGEENPFLFFMDHSDPELVETVRDGRKKEFEYFNFQGEYPDPKSEDTFRKSKLNWKLKEQNKNAVLFRFYKKLIELRKTHIALQKFRIEDIHIELNEEKNIISVQRFNSPATSSLFIIFNFGKTDSEFKITMGNHWKLILNSSAEEWLGGSEEIRQEIHSTDSIKVNAESVMVYESIA